MLGVPMTKAKMEEALRNETDDVTRMKATNEAVDELNNEEGYLHLNITTFE